MISRRPDDVSQEEAKNLLALFDLCLAEEIRNSSEDDLSSKLLSTMAKLNLEVDFQEEVASIFSRAINGAYFVKKSIDVWNSYCKASRRRNYQRKNTPSLDA